MASIYKRKNANGTTVWRAVIRLKGHPTVCIHRDRKEEAKDDASEIERQIKAGQFKFDQHKKLYTFNELIDRYILDGALEHHRSADDTKRHLAYWKSRLGAYALVHLNSGLLGTERRLLSEAEFEAANLKKREAVKLGKSDIDFWIQFAKEKGVHLPANWSESYTATLKASVGADPDMFELIHELKNQQIRVGLLSNINDRYTKLIRDFGFYQPFDPCLLSCEIGLEKPDHQAYEALLQAINLPAKEIVFIDDKLENVEAAKKMGIDAIVFESSQQVREELSKRALLKGNP